jgi:hypothetical protein
MKRNEKRTTVPGRLSILCLVALLAGCGGGGGGDDTVTTVPGPVDATLTGVMVTPTGAPCTDTSIDATGGLRFETSAPRGAQAYGCLAVDAAAAQPVFDGTQSLRFEVRPGDCSANDFGYSDCPNDRSRHEINESSRPGTQGKLVVYEMRVFVPAQPRLFPQGGNVLFLTQINFTQDDLYGTTAYLEVGRSGELLVRTHVGFTWDILKQHVVHANPVDRWVHVRFEIKSTAQPDGYIKVYVDGVLKVDEVRATLPNASAGHSLRLGIYNAFLSRASEPYRTQVVYFDGIKKQVN